MQKVSWHVAHGCMVTEVGERNTKWLWNREGEMNQWMALPSQLIQQASLPSSVDYFSPSFRSWALDHFSFPSPLHSTQFCHPAKETNQKALSLSLHTFPLSHSAVPCLCPLMVWSAPCCPSTLNFDPHTAPQPVMSQREQRRLRSDPRSNELVSSEHFWVL